MCLSSTPLEYGYPDAASWHSSPQSPVHGQREVYAIWTTSDVGVESVW